MSDQRDSGARIWHAGQRVALLILLVPLVGYLIIRAIRNPTYVSDPQPLEPARAAELADRIDPNTADAQTLAALPTLGEKRAQLIVDYRENYKRRPSNRDPAYLRPEDLLRIRGIGMATVDQIRPFLTFPGSATMPATWPTTGEN